MKDTMGTRDPKQIVEVGYDRVAKDYANLEGDIRWPRMRWLRKLLNLLEPCSRVLDIGCGSGDPADVEISKNHNVTGIDISKAQLSMARKNVPEGCFIYGDAASVEFPPTFFQGGCLGCCRCTVVAELFFSYSECRCIARFLPTNSILRLPVDDSPQVEI